MSKQVCAPVVQLVRPAWHAFAGVHASPAVHATQAPAPSQTLFVPHIAPAVTFPDGAQVPGGPEAQLSLPVLQTLVVPMAKEHEESAVHAPQFPAPSHTRFVPQLAPAALFDDSMQAPGGFERQLRWPFLHAFAGLQASAATHPTHAPVASQTWFTPQEVPTVVSACVSAQTGCPVLQASWPTWQAWLVPSAPGLQLEPAAQAPQVPW